MGSRRLSDASPRPVGVWVSAILRPDEQKRLVLRMNNSRSSQSRNAGWTYRGYQPSPFVDRWHRPRIESDNAAGTGIEGALTGSWRPPATGDASTQPVGHQLAADGPPRATEGPLPGVSSRLMHIGFIANLCPVAAVVFRSVASADHGSGMLCSGFQGEMALTNTRSGGRGACPAHRSRTGSAGRPLIMVAHRCTRLTRH